MTVWNRDISPGRLLAGVAGTASYLWIIVKYASWMGTVVLICLLTFAISSILGRHERHI